MIERLFRGQKWRKGLLQEVCPGNRLGMDAGGGVIVGGLSFASLSGAFHWEWFLRNGCILRGPTFKPVVVRSSRSVHRHRRRWAGGCTAATNQRNPSACREQLVAVVCFFIGGVATAMLMFKTF